MPVFQRMQGLVDRLGAYPQLVLVGEYCGEMNAGPLQASSLHARLGLRRARGFRVGELIYPCNGARATRQPSRLLRRSSLRAAEMKRSVGVAIDRALAPDGRGLASFGRSADNGTRPAGSNFRGIRAVTAFRPQSPARHLPPALHATINVEPWVVGAQSAPSWHFAPSSTARTVPRTQGATMNWTRHGFPR